MHYAMIEAANAGDEDAVSRLLGAGADSNHAVTDDVMYREGRPR